MITNSMTNATIQNALTELERYWEANTPLGDWKNAMSDMPLMTSFVHNFYNSKASANTKLSFYTDILRSFSNPGLEAQVTTDRFRGLGPLGVGIVKELVNDTINIRTDSSNTFKNEELRKEFVTSIWAAAGDTPNGPIFEKEIANSISNPNDLVGVIANMSVFGMFKDTNDQILKDMLTSVLPIASLLKQNNLELYQAFRKMLSAIEGYGVLLSVMNNIYNAALAMKPISVNNNVGMSGVSIDLDTPKQDNSLQSIIGDMEGITQVLAPFGQNVVDITPNIRAVLGTATKDEIVDIKNIINNSQIDIKNPARFASAVSATFAIEKTVPILQAAPANIATAMMYVSKIHADNTTQSDADTGQIGEGFRNITGADVVVSPGRRIGLTEAIAYDMVTNNYLATDSLGKLTNTPELCKFARICLNRGVNGVQPLNKENLLNYNRSLGTIGLPNLSIQDIESYLQQIQYPSNGNVAFRQQLLTSICDALKMI